MSKAFVSETDGDDEDEFGSVPELPQGTRNYITPGGYARIKEELDHPVSYTHLTLPTSDLV